MFNVRRIATVALLSGMALVVTATPAFAHARLIASDPAENAAVAAPPQQISLTFNEPVTPVENGITVTGPEGAAWTVGVPSVAGAVITIPVQPAGPAGPYTLSYRVTSSDGDPVTGDVPFTLAVAATTTTTTTTTATEPTTSTPPDAAPPAEDDSGLPVWVWIVGGIVVVAALVLGIRLARRSGS